MPLAPSLRNPSFVVRQQFYSKIAGVTFRNDDGSSRHRIIRKRARAGQPLTLAQDDTNPVDRNAVAALLPSGEQVGYFNRNLAVQIRRWLRFGYEVNAWIKDLTGDLGCTRGVNIFVEVRGPPPEPPGPTFSELRVAQRAAKAERRTVDLADLLLQEIEKRECSAARHRIIVRSYAFERLVALYLREGRRADALKVLQRYLALPANVQDDRRAAALRARLERLERVLDGEHPVKGQGS